MVYSEFKQRSVQKAILTRWNWILLRPVVLIHSTIFHLIFKPVLIFCFQSQILYFGSKCHSRWICWRKSGLREDSGFLEHRRHLQDRSHQGLLQGWSFGSAWGDERRDLVQDHRKLPSQDQRLPHQEELYKTLRSKVDIVNDIRYLLQFVAIIMLWNLKVAG